MYPHIDECPQLPYDAITSKNLLYDLLYNPDETLFMKKGALHGATVKTDWKCFCYKLLQVGNFGIIKNEIDLILDNV